jgi:hypothetical protein
MKYILSASFLKEASMVITVDILISLKVEKRFHITHTLIFPI